MAALTSCTTLTICFAAQIGKVTVATTHGHEWIAANSGKLRRYTAKKKTSLAAQKMKRTFCGGGSVTGQLKIGPTQNNGRRRHAHYWSSRDLKCESASSRLFCGNLNHDRVMHTCLWHHSALVPNMCNSHWKLTYACNDLPNPN